MEKQSEPRRSPEPCAVGCPGWCVVMVGGLCEDPDTLQIERCDDCWHGQPEPADDSDYEYHPVCLDALEAERVKLSQLPTVGEAVEVAA